MMEKKSNTEDSWFFFGVIVVIVPVIFAVLVACFGASKLPTWDSMLDDCLLVVFSIACNSVSISNQTYKLHKNKITKGMYHSSIIIAFFAWCFYIFALTDKISSYAKVIALLCIVVSIVLCFIGRKAAKMSDDFENQIITTMHENCDKIRNVLVSKRNNKKLESQVVRSDDLLCNPKEFDRVEKILEGINKKGENNE